MHEKVNFNGWPNCIRLFNKEIELVITTDIGPRIVSLGFINQQNFFYLVPDQKGKTGGNEWRIYGGHRLWHAPEAMPRSYNPDNSRVEFSVAENFIKLTQTPEQLTGIVKEMQISLSPDKNEIGVTHRLTNKNLWDIQLAPWSLSVLSPEGRAIIPQEPYGEGNDFLLPSRPLVLWPFTKMNDRRWIWGEKYIQARHDPGLTSEQKIGILNKQGWNAFYLNGQVLIKKFDYVPGASYTDYGCNNETYINGAFIEIETLGPFTSLAPGETVTHTENWLLGKTSADESEESIDKNILPLIRHFLKK